MAPQMPRPAPRATTSVYNTVIALLKNAIIVLLLVTGRFSAGLIWFENKNALMLHVHLQKRT